MCPLSMNEHTLGRENVENCDSAELSYASQRKLKLIMGMYVQAGCQLTKLQEVCTPVMMHTGLNDNNTLHSGGVLSAHIFAYFDNTWPSPGKVLMWSPMMIFFSANDLPMQIGFMRNCERSISIQADLAFVLSPQFAL